jgi:hypothetical protein
MRPDVYASHRYDAAQVERMPDEPHFGSSLPSATVDVECVFLSPWPARAGVDGAERPPPSISQFFSPICILTRT